MSADMTADALMAKAKRACASARLLLDAGDVDGASNRAYYAMFDAARAALLAADAPVPPDIGRTHGGLISAFALHLVKNGPVSTELGKAPTGPRKSGSSRTIGGIRSSLKMRERRLSRPRSLSRPYVPGSSLTRVTITAPG